MVTHLRYLFNHLVVLYSPTDEQARQVMRRTALFVGLVAAILLVHSFT